MADILLQKPQASQITSLTPAPEDRLVFEFDPSEALLERQDDNLVLSFEDGAVIELTDFYVAYTSENMPEFVIGEAIVPGESFFAALSEDLMPAAGPSAAPTGSGNGVGLEDGSLYGGIDRLSAFDSNFDEAAFTAPTDDNPDVNLAPTIGGFIIIADGNPAIAGNALQVTESGVGRDAAGNVDASNPNGAYGGDLSVSGRIVASDPDGDPLSYSIVSGSNQYGTLTLDAGSGVFTFLLNDAAANSLSQDDRFIEQFLIEVNDGQGGTAQGVLEIAVIGTNDLPVLSLAVNDDTVVTEDSTDLSVSGSLSVVDHDNDGDTLAEQNITINGKPVDTVNVGGDTTIVGDYGNLVVNADGTYTYTLGATSEQMAAVQNLGDESRTESFDVITTDKWGANDSETLEITVKGVNDAPQIVSPASSAQKITTDDSHIGTGKAEKDREITFTSDEDMGGGKLLVGTTEFSIAGNKEDGFVISGGPAITSFGEVTFNSLTFVEGTGYTLNYSYEQTGAFNHTNADKHNEKAKDADNFTIKIYDGNEGLEDGKSLADAKNLEIDVRVDIKDDGPNARNDEVTVREGGTVTGNVIDRNENGVENKADDKAGEDGWAAGGGLVAVKLPDGTWTATDADGDSVTHVDNWVTVTNGLKLTSAEGTITFDRDGSYEFTPTDDVYKDKDEFIFEYRVEDSEGDFDIKALTVNVKSEKNIVNKEVTTTDVTIDPVAEGDSSFTFNVELKNALGVYSEGIAKATITLPDGSTKKVQFDIDANGKGTYTHTFAGGVPSSSFTDGGINDSISVKINSINNDGAKYEKLELGSAESISITAVNDDPTLTLNNATMTSNDSDVLKAVAIAGSFNVADVDNDATALTITITGMAGAVTVAQDAVITGTNGTLTITNYDQATGSVEYSYTQTTAADHNNNSADEFKVVVSDGKGTDTQNITINIVDDVPIVKTDYAIVEDGETINVNFDTDLNSLNGSFTLDFGADDNAGKSITINGDQTATWNGTAWTMTVGGKTHTFSDSLEFGDITLKNTSGDTWEIAGADIGTQITITDNDGDATSFTLDANGELITDDKGSNLVFVVDVSKSTIAVTDYIDDIAGKIEDAITAAKNGGADKVNTEIVLFGGVVVEGLDKLEISSSATADEIATILNEYHGNLGEGSNLTNALNSASDIVKGFELANDYPSNVVVFSDGGTSPDTFNTVTFDDILSDGLDKNTYNLTFDLSDKKVGDVWLSEGKVFHDVGETEAFLIQRPHYLLKIIEDESGETKVLAEVASISDRVTAGAKLVEIDDVPGDAYAPTVYDIKFDISGKNQVEGETWTAKGNLYNQVGDTSMGQTLNEYKLTFIDNPAGDGLVLHAALAPQYADVKNNIAQFDDILVDGYDKNVYDIEFDVSGKSPGDSWLAKGNLYNQVGHTSMGKTISEYVLTLSADGKTLEAKKNDTVSEQTLLQSPQTVKFGDFLAGKGGTDGVDTSIIFDISGKNPGDSWTAKGIGVSRDIGDREYHITLVKDDAGNLSAEARYADAPNPNVTKITTDKFSDQSYDYYASASKSDKKDGWESFNVNNSSSSDANDALANLSVTVKDAGGKLVVVDGEGLTLPPDTIHIGEKESFDFDPSVSNHTQIDGTDRDDVLVGGMNYENLKNLMSEEGLNSDEDILLYMQENPKWLLEQSTTSDDAGNDTFDGGAGDDLIYGGAGDDIIYGGAGNDYLDGGAGENKLFGGIGDDLIVMNMDDVLIDGGEGMDVLLVGLSELGNVKDMMEMEDSSITNMEIVVVGEVKGTNVEDVFEELHLETTDKGKVKVDESWGNGKISGNFTEFSNQENDITILVETTKLESGYN